MAAAVPILIGISAGASIIGGISANNSARREAKAIEEQGRLQQEEATAEATAHAQDVRRFAANQSLSFLANGVTLAGSPLLVLEDTVMQGQNEVDSIVRSGNAARRLAGEKAENTRASGRAALIGGIASAAGTVATAGIAAKAGGLFPTGGTGASDFNTKFAAATRASRI